EHRYGWVMVVVGSVLMGMGAGALISISAFLKPLIAEFGWLRGETSFGYMAGALAMGIGGIVMGHLADRYSTRRVVFGGLICLGVSLLLLSTQSALWQFYLFYSLMGGFGSSSLDVPLLANIGHWFNRNKGLAIGLATAGRALGQGFVPFLSGYMISASGWRDAYTTLGLVTLVVMVPLALLVRNPPGFEEARAASRAASPADHDEAYPVPPKLAVSWIGVASVFCCACMGTAMVHAVAIAQDAGLGAEEAAAVILLMYVAGFFGRIFFGKLSDHIGGIRSYWLSSFGQTVFIFWFSQMDSVASFYTLAVAFGFFFGGVMTGLTVCVRELTPLHMRGVATGVVFFLAWVGMGIGGYQGGVFFDLSGSYVVSYANATIVGIINLMIVGALYVYVMRLKTAPA
ncbi:MAG: MFS transporter, partial [Alphaproteobacteria bacterium]|nr:MFS transporter [Alphaproteobacteria bacterium]